MAYILSDKIKDIRTELSKDAVFLKILSNVYRVTGFSLGQIDSFFVCFEDVIRMDSLGSSVTLKTKRLVDINQPPDVVCSPVLNTCYI